MLVRHWLWYANKFPEMKMQQGCPQKRTALFIEKGSSSVMMSKIGRFEKQLELKKFKLFFLCILHKKEGEERI